MKEHEHETLAPHWAMSVEDALKTLEATDKGLTEKEAAERRKRFGDNLLPRKKGTGPLTILLQQFASPLIFILIGAAVLTTLLQEWLDTVVILLAILVNAALGFYQEFRAEHVLEKLMSYVKERARVVRRANESGDGLEQEVDSVLVVPGDIVHLQYGARVPADMRLIAVSGLSIDESILTGESLPVAKTTEPLSEGTALADRTNMAFAGTLIVEGHATGVVAATDAHTEIGHIAELVSKTANERTPLQHALAHLAWLIFLFVAALVIGIFFLGIARGEPFFEMLLIAAAVAVGSIPEALPIALTVILAVGVERLAAKKGIMRSLAAAETLGSATVVMTDKTGTLTEADMRLVGVHTLKELASDAPLPDSLGSLDAHEREILEAALLGTNVGVENPSDAVAEWQFTGQPIEVGIVRAARDNKLDVMEFIHAERSPLLAFNSTNKFSISRHHTKNLFVALGAPDVLLARSKVSKDEFLKVEARIKAVSDEGKRLLGVARFPEHTHSRFEDGIAQPEDAAELELLGVLVFKDPVRPEAKSAIKKIESLGASVVMLTGDLKGTALAVARELGWQVHEGNALSGEEVRQLSDEELLKNLPNIRIFARVTPEDKLRIGLLYKKRGEIVAMTGDGVNDAPSLKAVDIGVALGSGSDVAKSTADLVLLDNNFKTIVAAIEEGRRILSNIRKTFVYLLSTSLDEVVLVGGALVFALPLPLTALQIIWVNFFTGSLPALSFAFDQNYDGGRGGARTIGAIFNREVKVLTLGVGAATSGLLFVLYWFLLKSGIDEMHARAILFICFSTYILVAAYCFRSLHKPLFSYPTFSNKFMNVSVLIATLLTAITVLPPLNTVFGVATPPLDLMWIVAFWLVLNIVIVEAAKWWFRTFSQQT